MVTFVVVISNTIFKHDIIKQKKIESITDKKNIYIIVII